MISVVRSIWAWASTALTVLIGLPLMAVVRLFDREPPHYHTGRLFRRLGALITYVNPGWTIEVDVSEIDDPRRPYVVVANHQSSLDIPVACRLPWEMKWVAKAELFSTPIVGWMLRLAGDIPVARGRRQSRADVLVQAQDYLDRRCSVMFFPEGTRSRDGRLLRFSGGAFRLAVRTGVPVLPVAIDGTKDALPKRGWRLSGGHAIRLKVLPPVPTAGLTPAEADAVRDRTRRAIAEQLAAWRGTTLDAVDAAMSRTGSTS